MRPTHGTERPGTRGHLCVLALVTAAAVALALAGCGSSGGDGGPSTPSGVALTFSGERVQLTRSITARATYTYAREAPQCDWYVDDVLGGNAQVGTITQGNPATYTAPQVVPAGGRVVITAADRAASSRTVSDTLDVVFTLKYADAANGTDAASAGTWATPFRTVSYGLGRVERGDTLHVLPGEYNEAHGEEENFPVPAGVTLRGASRDSCLLSGSNWNTIVLMYSASSLIEFAIGSEGDPPNHAIKCSSDSVLIRGIKLDDPVDQAAIDIHDPGSDAVIEDSEIVNQSDPGSGRGISLRDNTHCTIRNCTVSGWGYGFFINVESDPLIEGCTITENATGVMIYEAGAYAAYPDLGGGARGSAGGNTIQSNDCGVANQTDTTIWALYNTWDNDPPVEGPPFPCDIQNEGEGSVVF